MTEPRQILRWADPDQRSRDTSAFVDQFADCAVALASKPDTWAVIFSGTEGDAVKLSTAIRAGKGAFKATPQLRYEVKQRSHNEPGQVGKVHEVFVRCVPGYGATS